MMIVAMIIVGCVCVLGFYWGDLKMTAEIDKPYHVSSHIADKRNVILEDTAVDKLNNFFDNATISYVRLLEEFKRTELNLPIKEIKNSNHYAESIPNLGILLEFLIQPKTGQPNIWVALDKENGDYICITSSNPQKQLTYYHQRKFNYQNATFLCKDNQLLLHKFMVQDSIRNLIIQTSIQFFKTQSISCCIEIFDEKEKNNPLETITIYMKNMDPIDLWIALVEQLLESDTDFSTLSAKDSLLAIRKGLENSHTTTGDCSIEFEHSLLKYTYTIEKGVPTFYQNTVRQDTVTVKKEENRYIISLNPSPSSIFLPKEYPVTSITDTSLEDMKLPSKIIEKNLLDFFKEV